MSLNSFVEPRVQNQWGKVRKSKHCRWGSQEVSKHLCNILGDGLEQWFSHFSGHQGHVQAD